MTSKAEVTNGLRVDQDGRERRNPIQNKDKKSTCLELLTEACDMLGDHMFYYDEDGDSYNNGDVIAFIEKLDDFLSQNKAKEEPNARS